MSDREKSAPPLRIFCVEDNPLIVLHLEMLIEEIGHVFVGSSESFAELKARMESLDFDLALVDVDLDDGRTGGAIATWLSARGRPSFFVTGQDQIAADLPDASLGVIAKPVTLEVLASKLAAARSPGWHHATSC